MSIPALDPDPAANPLDPSLVMPAAPSRECPPQEELPPESLALGEGPGAGAVASLDLDLEPDPTPGLAGADLERTVAFVGDGRASGERDGFPEVDDLTGREFAQYRLGGVLGRGSMGRVYRAEHVGLRRICAVKVVNPGLVAQEPQTLDRFWAEARAIAGQIHPNIVTVHNLGTDRGYHYIEMEYVPGGVTLAEQVVRHGPTAPETATRLVRQVALALDAAHASGLVHRDVKPSNVLLTPDRNAKLADFGLARRLADLDARRGRLAGTPTYMAPELFDGAPGAPATDLYAVGVMYYYLLTARLPYSSDRVGSLIRLHRRAPVPDVRRLAPHVPDEAAALIQRLMAKNPLDRPRTAGEVADELRVLVADLRDSSGLVNEAIQGLGALVQHGGRDQFRLLVPVPGDRLQEVYVEVVSGRKRERLLTVFSVCGVASARHFEFALKLNAELAHGSISIREVNGEPMFVMSRTFLRANVTPAEIRAAIKEIARQGDQVEQQLSGTMDLF